MSDQIFQQAYDRVRSRYSAEAWLSIPPQALTDAIYKEIRLLDAERASATPIAPPQSDLDPPMVRAVA